MLGVGGRETDLVPRIRWKGVRRPWRDVEEVAMRWYCIHVLLSFRYGAVGRRFYVGMLDYWSFRKKGQKEGSDLGFANYDTTGHPSCSV